MSIYSVYILLEVFVCHTWKKLFFASSCMRKKLEKTPPSRPKFPVIAFMILLYPKETE